MKHLCVPGAAEAGCPRIAAPQSGGAGTSGPAPASSSRGSRGRRKQGDGAAPTARQRAGPQMATPGWVTPAPTMSAALRGCDCSEIYMDSLITCKEISGTGTADGYRRSHCTQHTTQEECAGSDGQYRGETYGSGPNTCKWYGTEESGDVTRTVNGTGHTGTSEFCATSI